MNYWIIEYTKRVKPISTVDVRWRKNNRSSPNVINVSKTVLMTFFIIKRSVFKRLELLCVCTEIYGFFDLHMYLRDPKRRSSIRGNLYIIHINAILLRKNRKNCEIIVIDGKKRKSKRKYISIHIIESIVPRGIGSNHLTHCRILP